MKILTQAEMAELLRAANIVLTAPCTSIAVLINTSLLKAVIAELYYLWAVEQKGAELRDLVLKLGELEWDGWDWKAANFGAAKSYNAVVARLREETGKEVKA